MGLSLFKIILFSLCIFSSCSMGIEEFHVETVQLNESNETIEIIFSQKLEGSSLVENLKVFEDSERKDGDLLVDGNKAIFYPHKLFRQYSDIVVEIDSNAESINGIKMQNIYRMEYKRKTDYIKPKVDLLVVPQTCDDKMTVLFNKDIDAESFELAFSIKPTVRYAILYPDKKSAEIIFSDKLKYNIRYELHISKYLQDGKYNFIESDYYESFILPKEQTSPEIIGYIFSNEREKMFLEPNLLYTEWSVNQEVFFESNVPLDMETIQSKISLYPEADFDFFYDKYTKDKFSILLKNIPYGKEYSLVLQDDITLLEQGVLGKELIYQFFTDNKKEKRPEVVVGILDFGTGDYFTVCKDTSYSQLNLDIEDFPPVSDVEYKEIKFYLLVSISDYVDAIELLSVFKSFNIEVSNNCVSLDIDSVNIVNSVKAEIMTFFEKFIFQNCVTKYKIIEAQLLIQNKPKKGLITFSVDSTLIDSLGNVLADDWVVPINKGF